jgi:hypothetical protein
LRHLRRIGRNAIADQLAGEQEERMYKQLYEEQLALTRQREIDLAVAQQQIKDVAGRSAEDAGRIATLETRLKSEAEGALAMRASLSSQLAVTERRAHLAELETENTKRRADDTQRALDEEIFRRQRDVVRVAILEAEREDAVEAARQMAVARGQQVAHLTAQIDSLKTTLEIERSSNASARDVGARLLAFGQRMFKIDLYASRFETQIEEEFNRFNNARAAKNAATAEVVAVPLAPTDAQIRNRLDHFVDYLAFMSTALTPTDLSRCRKSLAKVAREMISHPAYLAAADKIDARQYDFRMLGDCIRWWAAETATKPPPAKPTSTLGERNDVPQRH